MNVIISDGPDAEPIAVWDAKLYLRISHKEEDDLLEDILIPAARRYFEDESGWSLITRTLICTYRFWPRANCLILPSPPLQSVASVVYKPAGTAVMWDPSNYYVDTSATPGCVRLLPGGIWPDDKLYPPGITVTYDAGFGDAATDVPTDIREALYQLIGAWYENREAIYVPDEKRAGTPSITPLGAQQVIERYRRMLL